MTTGTCDDVRIPIEEPENLGWLYKIIEEPEPQRKILKPLIQKVAQTLRGIRSNETCFDPSVVSFGPYHHGKHHLKPMERYKEVAALWFIKFDRVNAITREEAKQFYDEFVAKVPSVSSLRDRYTDKFVDTINDADFMRMMFLDGCFMLYFILPFMSRFHEMLETSHLNRPLILRDMFLLENQIPYSVLVALSSLKPSLFRAWRGRDDWAVFFFKTVFLPSPSFFVSFSLLEILKITVFIILALISTAVSILKIICSQFHIRSYSAYSEEGTEPLHLLDLLRSKLTGEGVDLSVHGTHYWNYNFRPISELKAAGIQVSASNSWSLSLNNIKFKKGWIDSYLELPRIIIDDSTKTRLLNLYAYEMCPEGSLAQEITSYICFLNSLIYNADDVKELRSSNIMLNRLGSDQEVVNLFRELATNLSPDFTANYRNVFGGMEQHSQRCFNRPRMWIGQFIRTHFTSPWTAISLTAASFVVLLTLVQTIYSVLSFYKIE